MSFDAANVIVASLAIFVSAVLSLIAYRAAVKQNRLSASSVAADWIRDLRAWASEAVDVLAEASYTVRRGDPEPSADESICIHRCRFRLSALIDRGRFLLPNQNEHEHGAHKPRAYRGLRHHALDALVAADRVLGRDAQLGILPDSKSALIALRREFVTSIQSIIDPQSMNKQVAEILRLANETRAADPTLGGLLPSATSIPMGAEGILEMAELRYKASLDEPSRA